MSDRKYGQRGYQDSDRGERRPAPRPSGPIERKEGPRGRGLGAPTASVFRCAVCGAKQDLPGVAAFTAMCVKCGKDLHTCSHCIHFDTSIYKECRKQVPVRIAKKTTRNDCELFEAKVAMEFEKEAAGRPSDARSAFDALFRF